MWDGLDFSAIGQGFNEGYQGVQKRRADRAKAVAEYRRLNPDASADDILEFIKSQGGQTPDNVIARIQAEAAKKQAVREREDALNMIKNDNAREDEINKFITGLVNPLPYDADQEAVMGAITQPLEEQLGMSGSDINARIPGAMQLLRKRNATNLSEAGTFLEANPDISQEELGKNFNLSGSAVSSLYTNRDNTRRQKALTDMGSMSGSIQRYYEAGGTPEGLISYLESQLKRPLTEVERDVVDETGKGIHDKVIRDKESLNQQQIWDTRGQITERLERDQIFQSLLFDGRDAEAEKHLISEYINYANLTEEAKAEMIKAVPEIVSGRKRAFQIYQDKKREERANELRPTVVKTVKDTMDKMGKDAVNSFGSDYKPIVADMTDEFAMTPLAVNVISNVFAENNNLNPKNDPEAQDKLKDLVRASLKEHKVPSVNEYKNELTSNNLSDLDDPTETSDDWMTRGGKKITDGYKKLDGYFDELMTDINDGNVGTKRELLEDLLEEVNRRIDEYKEVLEMGQREFASRTETSRFKVGSRWNDATYASLLQDFDLSTETRWTILIGKINSAIKKLDEREKEVIKRSGTPDNTDEAQRSLDPGSQGA